MSLTQEIFRKLIHLSSIWIVIFYYFNDKPDTIYLLTKITILVWLLDKFRLKNRKFNTFINNVFGSLFRKNEKTSSISGASYFLIGSLITIIIAEKEISLIALTILIIADSFAAIIGKSLPVYKCKNNKTLSGSIAFLISSLFIIIIFNKMYIFSYAQNVIFVVTCLIITFLEFFAKQVRINDNLLIPVSFVGIYIILSKIQLLIQ